MRENPPYEILATYPGKRPVRIGVANGERDAASKIPVLSRQHPKAAFIYALRIRESSFLRKNPPESLTVAINTVREEMPWWPA